MEGSGCREQLIEDDAQCPDIVCGGDGVGPGVFGQPVGWQVLEGTGEGGVHF